jgi:hypothetical protein
LAKPNPKIYSRGFTQNLHYIFLMFIQFIMKFWTLNEFTGNLNLKLIWKFWKRLKQCRAGFRPEATMPLVVARDGGLAGPRHTARVRHARGWSPHSVHHRRRSCWRRYGGSSTMRSSRREPASRGRLAGQGFKDGVHWWCGATCSGRATHRRGGNWRRRLGAARWCRSGGSTSSNGPLWGLAQWRSDPRWSDQGCPRWGDSGGRRRHGGGLLRLLVVKGKKSYEFATWWSFIRNRRMNLGLTGGVKSTVVVVAALRTVAGQKSNWRRLEGPPWKRYCRWGAGRWRTPIWGFGRGWGPTR